MPHMTGKRKKKIKKMRPIQIDPMNPDTKLQIHVPTEVKELKKVKESDVFDKPLKTGKSRNK
jgi:pyruvate-formate lyase-activating enzyme